MCLAIPKSSWTKLMNGHPQTHIHWEISQNLHITLKFGDVYQTEANPEIPDPKTPNKHLHIHAYIHSYIHHTHTRAPMILIGDNRWLTWEMKMKKQRGQQTSPNLSQIRKRKLYISRCCWWVIGDGKSDQNGCSNVAWIRHLYKCFQRWVITWTGAEIEVGRCCEDVRTVRQAGVWRDLRFGNGKEGEDGKEELRKEQRRRGRLDKPPPAACCTRGAHRCAIVTDVDKSVACV